MGNYFFSGELFFVNLDVLGLSTKLTCTINKNKITQSIKEKKKINQSYSKVDLDLDAS